MDGYLVVKFGITAFKLYTVNYTLLTKVLMCSRHFFRRNNDKICQAFVFGIQGF